jgi:hypothetical protein
MTIWKLLKDPITGEKNVVWRKLENGRQESCLVTDVEYLKWVAEGNQPLPADEGNQ